MNPFIPTIIIVLPLLGFWIWMFRDMTNNDYLTANSKSTWALAFLFFNFFAAGLYYFMVYRNKY
jgi:hypothetical protein